MTSTGYLRKIAMAAFGRSWVLAVLLYTLSASQTSTEAFQPVDVKVTFDSDSSPDFKVLFNGVEWLRSGPVSIRDSGQTWASKNKDKYILKNVGHSSESGSDILGEFDTTTFTWQAFSDESTSLDVKIETCVSVYRDEPVVYFSLVYTSGLTKASMANVSTSVLSSFPSFIVEDANMKRGYVTWFGGQISETAIDEWPPLRGIYQKLDGGFPLVIYNQAMDTAVVLSPATTFMSATLNSSTDPQTNDTTLTFGPMSSIDEVPAGYKFDTILVAGNNVTGVMHKFGELLRRKYSKTLDYKRTDFSLNYLGYWTDNGACYYHTSGSQYSNYEDLLIAIKKDADQKDIPFRYVQLDDWWYYWDKNGAVKNWTAMPNIFPNGIPYLVNKTGWRVFAHNKWWSPNTDYQKKFKFIVEDDIALPVDPTFWDFLLSNAQKDWELFVYEQDFLLTQFGKTKALQTQLDLGELWLKQMGEAAQRYGITIQYCMSWTRHIMQSIAIPVVTQNRASRDYQPSNDQWLIGDSSILSHTVGIAPSKDNFRTSSKQPDCKQYRGGLVESTPTLEAYVAVLSGGPVGPSDQVGTANISLIMATCMKDGLLLRPSRPALSIDSTFVQRAFGSGGPDGHVVAAFTEIDQFTWYYVLTADLASPYTLTAKELPPSRSTFPATTLPFPTIAFRYTLDGNITEIVKFGTQLSFGSDTALNIAQCGKSDFQYWVIPPYIPFGFSLLGELNKITPVSEQRFSDIVISDDYVKVKVNGVPGEKVYITVYENNVNKTQVMECTISESGTNVLVLGQECYGV